MWSQLRDTWVPKVNAEMSTIMKDISPAESTLIDMAEFHLGTGGKRLRALLPIAVSIANHKDPEGMLSFAAACELLHNATLVHDDLQDGDETRRDQPTIWVKYGKPQAINLGDALLYYAIGGVIKTDAPAELKQRTLRRFVSDSLQVIDGQEREFLLQEETATLEDYFRMVEGKTSGLFSLPFAGAASLCGASDETLDAIEKASTHLGVAFQIQDDVLDIYADKGRERRGSDIAEGKRSVLAVYALTHAEETDRAWLFEVLNRERKDVSDDDIARATELFRTSGALKFAMEEIDRRISAMRALLADDATHGPIADALSGAFMEPIRAVQF